MDNGNWLSFEKVTTNLQKIIYKIMFDLSIDSNELPYIMAIFKFHKKYK